MSPVIHLQPIEAFTYYIKNKARLEEELVEIAINKETKTSVYMTDENDNPYLYVYRSDKKIFQTECPTAFSTKLNLQMIYAKYLTSLPADAENNADEDNARAGGADDVQMPTDDEDDDLPPFDNLDSMSEAEFNDMVNDREDVIYSAVYALIEALTEDDMGALDQDGEDGDCIDDIVDHIVEYLAIKCGLRIRRPMTVVDDKSGLSVRTEYPYEEYEFSDSELHG